VDWLKSGPESRLRRATVAYVCSFIRSSFGAQERKRTMYGL
jgi:hypothetical protein